MVSISISVYYLFSLWVEKRKYPTNTVVYSGLKILNELVRSIKATSSMSTKTIISLVLCHIKFIKCACAKPSFIIWPKTVTGTD